MTNHMINANGTPSLALYEDIFLSLISTIMNLHVLLSQHVHCTANEIRNIEMIWVLHDQHSLMLVGGTSGGTFIFLPLLLLLLARPI